MKKVYKKLTKDQIKRGVIFSSCLSVDMTEREEDHIHEVLKDSEDKDKRISRLLDDKFFNASHWNFNIVRDRV